MLSLLFLIFVILSAKNHTETGKKAAEIFARQRSPLLHHHVIKFAVALSEQTKPTRSIHAVYSDAFFVLRNCASNGDLSCGKSCEREKKKEKQKLQKQITING